MSQGLKALGLLMLLVLVVLIVVGAYLVGRELVRPLPYVDPESAGWGVEVLFLARRVLG